MSESSILEWVQIIEPKTKEFMYANLVTGECLWEAPDVPYKESDETEWWELYDSNTTRFYYYNVKLQETVWHKPLNCDIIPLAKLQAIKRNSSTSMDSNDGSSVAMTSKKDISTQTLTKPTTTTTLNNNDINQVSRHNLSDEPTDLWRVRHLEGSMDDSHISMVERKRPPLHVQQTVDNSDLLDRKSTEIITSQLREGKRQQRAGSGGQIPPPPPPPPNQMTPDWSQQRRSLFGIDKKMKDAKVSLASPSNFIIPEENSSLALASESPVSMGTLKAIQSMGQSFDHHHHRLHIHSHFIAPYHHPQQQHVVSYQMRQHHAPPHVSTADPRRAHPGAYLHASSGTGISAISSITSSVSSRAQPISTTRQLLEGGTKPRAFPRTNPSYVGTYRRPRPSGHQDQPQQQQQHTSQISTKQKFQRPTMDDNFLGNYYNFSDDNGNSDDQSTDSYRMLANQSIYANALDLKTPDQFYQSRRPHQQSGHQGHFSSNQYSVYKQQQHHPPVAAPRSKTHNLPSEPIYSNEQEKFGESSPGETNAQKNRWNPFLFVDKIKKSINRRGSEPEYVNVVGSSAAVSTSKHHQASANYFHNFLPTSRNGIFQYGGRRGGGGGRYSPPERSRNTELYFGGRHHNNAKAPFSTRISDGLPEIDFDDSDAGSAQSTPSPQSRQFQTLMPASRSHSSSTYHPSLRKKRWTSDRQAHSAKQESTLEKSWSLQAELAQHRPQSMLNPNYHHPQPGHNIIANKVAGTLLQQMHIEQFVLENLNEHKKWLLGKTVSVGHMLSWTKDPITKPMIRTDNKGVKKEAPELFKLIQSYMGDRKAKESLNQIALEVAVKGWTCVELRDEIYIQLCRQTTKNPKEESAVQGWELLGICLAFFPPSGKFYSYLEGHICKNIDAYNQIDKTLIYIYTVSCQKRLEWIVNTGAKRGLKKPCIEEIEHAKKSLVEQSMFGCTLSEVMHLQKDRFPERRLPWIQTVLSDEVLRLSGIKTEGIFRVPGDIDEVNALKVRCDRWMTPPPDLSDPHVPASLLKLWYRELHEPLIPFAYHQRCVDNFADPEVAMAVVNGLPEINRLVLTYLVRFLQEFCRSENVTMTKMDVNNLSMIMAPNCLRCLSSDPRVIFENTRKEMGFMRTLILHLDTSEVKDML